MTSLPVMRDGLPGIRLLPAPLGARVYDALLGGKDNFAPDQKVAQAMIKSFPAAVESVHANRAFLERTVTYLVNEADIRQFLDIGTGLPSADNTHEVAQRYALGAGCSTWTTTVATRVVHTHVNAVMPPGRDEGCLTLRQARTRPRVEATFAP
jgi:hypothetical protein